MQQRKDEILAKKAKLAELKRQREQRSKEFTATRQSIGTPSDRASPARNESRKELDNLISSLVGEDRGSSAPGTPPSARVGRSRPSSYQQSPARTPSNAPGNSTSAQKATAQTGSTGSQTLSLAPLRTVYEIRSDPPKRETITYSKAVQTPEVWSHPRSASPSESDTESSDQTGDRRQRRELSRRQRERDEELRQNIRREIQEELGSLQKSRSNDVEAEKDESKPGKENFPARALTNEELEAVTSSNDFLEFVERSSKVIERALDDEYDVLADYRQDHLRDLDEDDDGLGGSGKKGRRIKEVMQFYDSRWSRKRIISDIDFSPKFSELLLTSHTKNSSAPHDPAGVVLVWNTHMHSRPEHVFHSTSDLLTAKFSPFHPNLIFGGTYSGQILLWDNRLNSPHAVQKSPLTGMGTGHTHPVYSLNVVGTQNAHSLVSASTDGVICAWSPDVLGHPQEYLELTAPPALPITFPGSSSSASTTTNENSNPYLPNLPDPFNITPSTSSTPSFTNPTNKPLTTTRPTSDLSPLTTAIPPSDPTHLLLGTESGALHMASRYPRAGLRSGIDPSVLYSGHTAPVLALDFHKPAGPLDLSDLCLSAGLDWTVKLWRVRSAPGAGTASMNKTNNAIGISSTAGLAASNTANTTSTTTTTTSTKQDRTLLIPPLLSLSREDAIYDVKWSPARPGVFGCVDGAGALEIWDLAVETEVPVAKTVPDIRVGVDGLPVGGPPPTGAQAKKDRGGGLGGGGGDGGLNFGLGGSGVVGSAGNARRGRALNKLAWEPAEGRRVAVGGLDGVAVVYEVGSGLGGLEGVRGEEWAGLKRLVVGLEGGGR